MPRLLESLLTGLPSSTSEASLIGALLLPAGSWRPNVVTWVMTEIFKILWSEPKSSSQSDAQSDAITIEETSGYYGSRMGDKFYIGFRRFLVVANDETNCTCVPILTYERRGCTKRGVKPLKHGIITARYTIPCQLPGEPKLGFLPIRMDMDYHAEKLAKESRVNYSKLVTIEHSSLVFFIGRVVDEDLDLVVNAVDKCWAEKWRKTNLDRQVKRKEDGLGESGKKRNAREHQRQTTGKGKERKL
ncbi:hypothetical protein B0T18DRAFT_463687 [Schizothecium vesticola]|uniref:DUF6590 domain-containing protein n=1 Tax=Schizothecium vesticola TaxID=314040 RepID=A0AA40EU01_9PEZI|nr:hypothetical protein B0T18DRAFT_463687 [Schizothecium vesticola]